MPVVPPEPTKGDELRFQAPGTHSQGHSYKITIYINGALFINNENVSSGAELAMNSITMSDYRSFAVSGWIERIG